jgi:hypothetical protein
MKTLFSFFEITIFLFLICATNNGNCQSTMDRQVQSLQTRQIVDEISSFIDDDTAIICYINLLAAKNYHQLVGDITRALQANITNKGILQFLKDQKKADNKDTSQLMEQFSPLVENNVTHLYFILNMRDLKFGSYFIIPEVQENTIKAKNIEKFFGVKTITNDKDKFETWAIYKKNYVIIGGFNSILSYINSIYYFDERLVLRILVSQRINAICGFYNLSVMDRKKYINQRFDNLKPSVNKNFQRGMEEVNDCDFIRTVFLFPDSVVSWEFMHLKKMDEPLNLTTFEFLSSVRDYAALGIDTKQPKIKLTIQCKSNDDAIKFKKLIDEVIWNLINNYCKYSLAHPNKQSSNCDKNDTTSKAKSISSSEWADFIVSLLPQFKDTKLITIIRQNYKINID